jgi:hypothetical protein
MALVERLMGLADDGTTPVGQPQKIPVHAFFAANHQRIEAAVTRADIISLFVLDADDVTEYDTLAALAPTGTNALQTAQKAMFIEKMHAVLILAEGRYAGYDTPTVVRTKLGL